MLCSSNQRNCSNLCATKNLLYQKVFIQYAWMTQKKKNKSQQQQKNADIFFPCRFTKLVGTSSYSQNVYISYIFMWTQKKTSALILNWDQLRKKNLKQNASMGNRSEIGDWVFCGKPLLIDKAKNKKHPNWKIREWPHNKTFQNIVAPFFLDSHAINVVLPHK